MSSNTVIKVSGVSKRYEIYKSPQHRFMQLVFPNKKYYQEFWALKDVSFELQEGECLGLVGRNGAGKSTLLQILAGTSSCTTGQVEINGQVGALLELGSGFNPEFTGRENVYLNASIIGLSSEQVDGLYPEILAFSEMQDFIDQPLKTYSSGMKMRLAFAVQAQLRPKILIIDEALAVGDAAFQMKCMATMNDLLAQGTTIILVTHSVQTVRTFCNKALWLDNGQVKLAGSPGEVTNSYMEYLFSGTANASQAGTDSSQVLPSNNDKLIDILTTSTVKRRWGDGQARVKAFAMFDDRQEMAGYYKIHRPLSVVFVASLLDQSAELECSVAFAIRDRLGVDVIAYSSAEQGELYSLSANRPEIKATFELQNILVPGEYALILAIEYFEDGKRRYADYVEDAYLFSVVSDGKHFGIVEPDIKLEIA